MPRSLLANRVRTAQVLLIVVMILGALYVMDAVVGSGLIRRPYDVTVNLSGSGGLYKGAVVSYRGNRIGKVTDLDVTDSGVRAVASIQKGTQIPVDTEAVVSNLSAVGEQRLDFRPRVDHGPWLKAGSVVAQEDTALPLATSTFFLHTKKLTDQIDVNDVRTISRELDVAFGDPDLDLRRLYDTSDRTLGTLERLEPATISLIERGQVPLQTLSDKSGEFLQFSKDVQALTASLNQANPDLASLLRNGNVLVPQLRGTLNENATTLADLLGKGRVVSEIGADRQPALMTWLDYVPLQAKSMIAGTRDGSGRVVLVPNPSKLCKYDTRQRLPADTSKRPPARDGHCTKVDPLIQQRGAQYVPKP
jgi:phospholipid/cholesterol/gamma-HCH transport system substrate-binding protein